MRRQPPNWVFPNRPLLGAHAVSKEEGRWPFPLSSLDWFAELRRRPASLQEQPHLGLAAGAQGPEGRACGRA